jgi:hypothetical protein
MVSFCLAQKKLAKIDCKHQICNLTYSMKLLKVPTIFFSIDECLMDEIIRNLATNTVSLYIYSQLFVPS